MPTFELNRLLSYDDEALLVELRRVAALVECSYLTKVVFDRHSKASSSVICVHFGRWEIALERAGLRSRYTGTPDGKRALAYASRSYSDDRLLDEIRTVATKIRSKTVSRKDFDQHATMTSFTVHKRFGSWLKALEIAGLGLSKKQKKHTEEDYFENLLTVWTHYGRQPHYGEMQREPSRITASAYERKWGTWRKALLAFIDRVNSDTAQVEPVSPSTNAVEETPLRPTRRRVSGTRRVKEEDRHGIRLGLRYTVLQRDRFRCAICGRSPATHLGVVLHVDHVVAWAKGGKTSPKNLRSSCADCNLGKGSQHEEGSPVSQ
jgi:5-methylcytosine-specific restriction endonuclease McrA